MKKQIIDVTVENYLEKIAECVLRNSASDFDEIDLVPKHGESHVSIKSSIDKSGNLISGFYCSTSKGMVKLNFSEGNWGELIKALAERYPSKVGDFTNRYLFRKNNPQPKDGFYIQFANSVINSFEKHLTPPPEQMPFQFNAIPDMFLEQNNVTVSPIPETETTNRLENVRPQKRTRIDETPSTINPELNKTENTNPIFNNEGEPIYRRETQQLIITNLITEWHNTFPKYHTYASLENALGLKSGTIFQIKKYGCYLYSDVKIKLFDYLITHAQELVENEKYLENLAKLEIFKALTQDGQLVFDWQNELRIIESLIQNWARSYLNTNSIDERTIQALAQAMYVVPEKLNAIWKNPSNLTSGLKNSLFQYLNVYFTQNVELTADDAIQENLEKLRIFQNSEVEPEHFAFRNDSTYSARFNFSAEKEVPDNNISNVEPTQFNFFAEGEVSDNISNGEPAQFNVFSPQEESPVDLSQSTENSESNLPLSKEEPQVDLTDEEVAFLLRMT